MARNLNAWATRKGVVSPGGSRLSLDRTSSALTWSTTTAASSSSTIASLKKVTPSVPPSGGCAALEAASLERRLEIALGRQSSTAWELA